MGIRLLLSISRARPGDAEKLAGDDISHLGLLRERLVRVDQDKGALLVARRFWFWKAVGHIYLWWEQADEPELREMLPDTPLLMNLWVRKDHRRKGIGTALVAKAERRLRKRSCRRVALGVEVENTTAINLYLKHGYTEWGKLTTHYDEFQADGTPTRGWEICMVYTKDLSPTGGSRRFTMGWLNRNSPAHTGQKPEHVQSPGRQTVNH